MFRVSVREGMNHLGRDVNLENSFLSVCEGFLVGESYKDNPVFYVSAQARQLGKFAAEKAFFLYAIRPAVCGAVECFH